MLKKLLLIIFSLALFLNSFALPTTVSAQPGNPTPTPGADDLWNHEWYSEQNPFTWYSKVYDEDISPTSEIFGERYTAAQVQWILYSLWAHVWNYIPGNPELTTCLASGNTTECLAIFENAIGLLTADTSNPNLALKSNSFLSTLGQNPISGIRYTKDLISKFNPVTGVQAQGFGFNSGANPAKVLWQATRNISYALIVLAVIVIAFMIMFRMKISPQVVISVQSAIPNIIVTTILITFSYAIAGFVIDLMYVVIALIASLLQSNHLSGTDSFNFMFGTLNVEYNAFMLMYQYWVAFMYNALLAIFTNLSSALLGILVFLFSIISIFAILFWSIKIIYVILKNFAMIMITIAIGPLQILAGAFTGKSSFGGWLRKLVSLLAVYPLLGIIFFFSFFFLVQGSDSGLSGMGAGTLFGDPTHDVIGDNSWLPPFSGFALGDNILWVVVSFVIFSNATKVVEIIQSAIAGKPFSFGSAIGEATQTAGITAEALGDKLKYDWRKPGTGAVVKGAGELMKLLGKVGG